jgi:hypothetical protein
MALPSSFCLLPSNAMAELNRWYSREEANRGWPTSLHCVHPRLPPGDGDRDPEPGPPELWEQPTAPSNYHWGATFEMRSKETPGGHGHQVTYDANGRLITDSNCPVIGPSGFPCISAGTADRSHPSNYVLETHYRNDVPQFILAAQLDGNPVEGTWLGLVPHKSNSSSNAGR